MGKIDKKLVMVLLPLDMLREYVLLIIISVVIIVIAKMDNPKPEALINGRTKKARQTLSK